MVTTHTLATNQARTHVSKVFGDFPELNRRLSEAKIPNFQKFICLLNDVCFYPDTLDKTFKHNKRDWGFGTFSDEDYQIIIDKVTRLFFGLPSHESHEN